MRTWLLHVLGRHRSRLHQGLARDAVGNVIVAVALLCLSLAHPAAAQTCATDTIGNDLSIANWNAGSLLGSTAAQSFIARDTLLQFLRVWRVASEDSLWNIGIHLVITEADSNDIPLVRKPVVLNGPTLLIPNGDGVHPIEFKWTFDPPFALPHAGKYMFFLFQDPCAVYFDVLATHNYQVYSDGMLWASGRSGCSVASIGSGSRIPQADLVFQIGFCKADAVPTRRHSWGELKILYR